MENQKYKLSKDAIKHLDDIKIENKTHMSIKSIIIESNFIFQIEKIDKIKKGIYSSTLIDNDFKSDKFILNFEKEEEIPKKGNIIKIGQIEKSYNEEKTICIYDCKKINIISKEIHFIDDLSKIIKKQKKEPNQINNGNIMNNINDNYEESETDEEEEEEEDDNDYNDGNNKIDINMKNENYINNYEIEKKSINYNKINIHQNDKNNIEDNESNSNKNQENHNFLLISDLNQNIQNFQIYIKCIKKDEIKEFR